MPKRTIISTKPLVKVMSVKAVFCPIGNVNVNLTAPSGNQYQIRCRQLFTIQSEDVDFFFVHWDWKFRQRLFREGEIPADLHAYSDSKRGAKNQAPGVGIYGAKVSEEKSTPGLAPAATVQPKKVEPRPDSERPLITEDKE